MKSSIHDVNISTRKIITLLYYFIIIRLILTIDTYLPYTHVSSVYLGLNDVNIICYGN